MKPEISELLVYYIGFCITLLCHYEGACDRGNLRLIKALCLDCFASLAMTLVFMNHINNK